MSASNLGLPDGTEDFVGFKAKELENLRSLFLNYFYKNNCELVIPSLIEFSDVIGGNANDSLKDYAYSFSDENLKNSYRSYKNNDEKIKLYSENLPILENDTQDIIEYVKQTNKDKKKKFNFWKLLEND